MDGECLADVWRALDCEGCITVVDERNGEIVGADGFAESLSIGVGDSCIDSMPLEGFGND